MKPHLTSRVGIVLAITAITIEVVLILLAIAAMSLDSLFYLTPIYIHWFSLCVLLNCFAYDTIELPLIVIGPILNIVIIYFLGKYLEIGFKRLRRSKSPEDQLETRPQVQPEDNNLVS